MKSGRTRCFHEDDGGFSTVGMVLALLISLALIFTSAQVYRIQSYSADIQNVADASVLAAENQVASFYVVGQVCDAAVLTLSLTGVAVAGVGAVALCVPGGQAVGEKCLEAARKIMQARNRFSKKASEGLNKLQKLLPFIAAAESYGVAAANGEGHQYFALAVLLPTEGEQIQIEEVDGEGAVEDLQNKQDQIEEAARQAEDAAKRADEHKQRAYQADCGAAPGFCMEERAGSLAGMGGWENPHYATSDAWSFSVALQRAQTYYPRRLAQEAPANGSVGEQSNSALRKRMYAYAVEQVNKGYVHEDAEGFFEADFPLIPRNTAELRQTELYTQQVYPISQDEEGNLSMHAWSGCPGLQGKDYAGCGSIAQMESGGYIECDQCRFVASSLGSVAAASTSTSNGFEHYYRIVAEEAEEYEKARAEQRSAMEAVKNPISEALGEFLDIAKKAAQARIELSPPGRYGAIAIAVNTTALPVAEMFPNGFVRSSGSLGPRAALSAAMLGEDDPEETENVITSLFDGFLVDSQGIATQSLPLVLDLWSMLLTAHSRGVSALEEGVENALGGIPLVGHCGLGTWARGKLEDVVEQVGLEPADLTSYKPILANTYQVASQDGSIFSRALLGSKKVAAHIPASAVNPVGAAIDATASFAEERIDGIDDEMEIATIEILGEGGPSLPVKVPLPPAVKKETKSLVESAREQIASFAGVGGGEDVWK